MMDSQEATDAAIARLRGDRKVLFIAVSTGQGLANLSPILEVARPGDEVLWLESERAAREQYTAGPREVLLQRQIHSRVPVRISDSPREIAETLRDSLARETSAKPVLVQNGGTKLTGLGLDHGADHAMPVLYGDVDPAHLVIFPEGVMGPELRRPYRVADLGLEEIMTSSGSRIMNLERGEKLALRVWPGPSDPWAGDYGVDPHATNVAHKATQRRDRWLKIQNGDWPKYGSVELFDSILSEESRRLTNWTTALISKAAQLAVNNNLPAEFFNGAVNLSADVGRTIARRAAPPAVRLGDLFEQAVARRVRAWLEKMGYNHGVVEAWTNVKVIEHDGSTQDAEWDVVLVLRGAIVVHLECKTFAIDDKDLDARLLNLTTAAGQMAKMYICSPVYTQFDREDWFKETLAKSDRLRKAVNGNWIGFGLPCQTPEYTRPAKGGGFAQHRCEPFEDRLSEILGSFLPV